jgi:hypothetical protein
VLSENTTPRLDSPGIPFRTSRTIFSHSIKTTRKPDVSPPAYIPIGASRDIAEELLKGHTLAKSLSSGRLAGIHRVWRSQRGHTDSQRLGQRPQRTRAVVDFVCGVWHSRRI